MMKMDNNILKYALELENVTGKRGKFRLKDINIQLEPGYIYAVAGENGAGKTTLMRYIISEQIKYSGTIRLYGENVKDKHHRAMEKIGFVSEDNIFLEKRTALQNAGILGILYDDFDIELFKQYMKRMGASVNTAYDRMSRGERMKFQLAFAIAHKSKLYLLDEATAGIDSVFCTELFDILRNLLVEECCVLMTSHNMSEIEKQTDYVAIMKNGSIGGFKESMEVSVNSHEENRL